MATPVEPVLSSRQRSYDCFDGDLLYLGRYRGAYPRNSALKCVSRGATVVYVLCNSKKQLRRYEGYIEELDKPNVTYRGQGERRRKIVYKKIPHIRYVPTKEEEKLGPVAKHLSTPL